MKFKQVKQNLVGISDKAFVKLTSPRFDCRISVASVKRLSLDNWFEFTSMEILPC